MCRIFVFLKLFWPLVKNENIERLGFYTYVTSNKGFPEFSSAKIPK